MTEVARDAAIHLSGLTKRYPGSSTPAVNHLDLLVPRGSLFGLLGPNGAGKTSTIGMLLGNVRPTTGEGWVLGKPLGDRETRRRIGYLPEKFVFPEYLSAYELLDFHARLCGMEPQERRRAIPDALEKVGLADVAHRRLATYSKGMQQRAGLAQAIVHQPELVILDEPTSALDPIGRRDVRDLLLHLKSTGTTVLLNSHLLSEVERTCDTLALVRKGQVVRQGTTSEITSPSSEVRIELEVITPSIQQAATHFGTVTVSPPTLSVQMTDGQERIADLVAALVAAGARIRAVEPVRETLEEAFIRLLRTEETPL